MLSNITNSHVYYYPELLKCHCDYPNLLTVDEYLDLSEYILERRPLTEAANFRQVPRVRCFGINLLNTKPRSIANYPLVKHTLAFCIDKLDGYTTIVLTVVALFAFGKSRERKDLRVRIRNRRNGDILCDTMVATKFHENCYPLQFARPIRLSPNVIYTLIVDDADGDLCPVDLKSQCVSNNWVGFSMSILEDESNTAVFDMQFKCWNEKQHQQLDEVNRNSSIE